MFCGKSGRPGQLNSFKQILPFKSCKQFDILRHNYQIKFHLILNFKEVDHSSSVNEIMVWTVHLHGMAQDKSP